jgi:hypothetical protein
MFPYKNPIRHLDRTSLTLGGTVYAMKKIRTGPKRRLDRDKAVRKRK